MSDQDNKDTQEQANQAIQDDANKPLFVIGEREYKTVDEAVTKITHADSHIRTIEEENKRLKEELQKAQDLTDQSTKLDEVLAKLQATPQTTVSDNTSQDTTATQSIDLEALKKELLGSVDQKFTATQQQQLAQSNMQQSMEMAQKVFGDQFNAKLREKAQSLGMSDDEIVREAQSNPNKFKVLFGLDRESKPNLGPSGSVNNRGLKAPDTKLDLRPKLNSHDRKQAMADNMRKLGDAMGIKTDFHN